VSRTGCKAAWYCSKLLTKFNIIRVESVNSHLLGDLSSLLMIFHLFSCVNSTLVFYIMSSCILNKQSAGGALTGKW
jgi:hypothetical protein